MKLYDIGAVFGAIEDELVASMMRNMKKHRDWEDEEEFHWGMWQAYQLEALERYRRTNKKKFKNNVYRINGSIKKLIEEAREQGGMDQEIAILEKIKEGWLPPKPLKTAVKTSAEFFRLNTRSLEALIKATENDFEDGATAILRRAEDQYRQIIFSAQAYANTGAGTYEKAVDMATRHFLEKGIDCIEYKNGARHTMKDYADMAIRTAAKRAYLTGEGEKRQEWGISTVIINKRGNPCPKCLPFVGKIMIDDVWSGGTAEDGEYPLLSSAIDAGLYHPRCKDSHSTYFPGITTVDDPISAEDIENIKEEYTVEQRRMLAKRNYEKYSRLAEYSLDEENQKKYKRKAEEWKGVYSRYYRDDGQKKADKEQFKKYKEVLKGVMPKTIAEFVELKYNNETRYNALKYMYRTVNRYEIEGNVPANVVVKLDNAAWYTKQLGFDHTIVSGKDAKRSVIKIKTSGNGAAMMLDDEIYFSHSRLNMPGTAIYDSYVGDYPLIGLQEERIFEVKDLGDKILREYDTEAKFLEYVATIKKPTDKFKVTILSEKHICESCRGVVEQFKKMFPKAKVNIISGKKGYNNNPSGLKTWAKRKKV